MKTSTLNQQASLLGGEAMPKSALSTVIELRARALGILGRLDWLALLLGRLAVGLLFLSTGWGKVHDIPKVTAFFESLHIPAPGFHAVLVGYSELLCGSALVIGLLSRFATVPLMVSMIVALITAKAGDIHGILDLVGQDEFTYLVVLFMIAILGPGRASVDAFIARKLDAAKMR
jgi:putative oxidoreductase